MNVNENDGLQKKLEQLMMNKMLSNKVSQVNSKSSMTSRRRIMLPTEKVEDQNKGVQEAESVVGSTQSNDLGKGAQRPPKREAKFEETHKRFTTYLEIELLAMIQRLNKIGAIKSMTAILNDAVYEYIHKYFPNELKK